MPTTVLSYFAAGFCALAVAALVAAAVGLVILALFRGRKGRGAGGALAVLGLLGLSFAVLALCGVVFAALLPGFLKSAEGPSAAVREKPAVADVAGTWVVDPEAVKFVRGYGYTIPPNALILRAGGTCEFQNVPNLRLGMDDKIGGELLNGPCTWALDTNANGNWEVQTFAGGLRSRWFTLAGPQAPYSLYYGMTDPDAPMPLFFRRRE